MKIKIFLSASMLSLIASNLSYASDQDEIFMVGKGWVKKSECTFRDGKWELNSLLHQNDRNLVAAFNPTQDEDEIFIVGEKTGWFKKKDCMKNQDGEWKLKTQAPKVSANREITIPDCTETSGFMLDLRLNQEEIQTLKTLIEEGLQDNEILMVGNGVYTLNQIKWIKKQNKNFSNDIKNEPFIHQSNNNNNNNNANLENFEEKPNLDSTYLSSDEAEEDLPEGIFKPKKYDKKISAQVINLTQDKEGKEILERNVDIVNKNSKEDYDNFFKELSSEENAKLQKQYFGQEFTELSENELSLLKDSIIYALYGQMEGLEF